MTTTFLKSFCFFLAICLFAITGTVKAQLTLTSSGGITVPTPYTTLKAAFDAINAGTHTGTIDIAVAASTNETAMAVLNGSGGTSSYVSVTIKPTVAGVIINGNLSTAIVKLNGADNVTFDGFISGGPARDLTIRNQSTANTSGVVWIASASASDGSTNNSIKNCNITGGSTTVYYGITQASGATPDSPAEVSNSNNSYSNNVITNAYYGVRLIGNDAAQDDNVLVTDNTINTLGRTGIWSGSQKNITIRRNTISGINSNLGGLAVQNSGIMVAGVTTGGLIEKNTISNVKIASFWGCNGIQLNATNSNTGLRIINNMIHDIAAGGWGSFDSVDDNGCGIAVDEGGGYLIYYNSINLTTNQGTGITAALWLAPGLPTGAVTVKNNIFSNVQTAATRYAVYCNSANTVFALINYNDYWSTGSIGFLSSGRPTLANWVTATGQDANSVSVNPFFVSPTNLHLAGNSPLDGLGNPVAGITVDFDNDPRNATTPDIGADEFTPPNCTNPVTGGTATASTIDICASGSAVLSATGYSFGVGIAYQWEVSTTGCGGGFAALAGQTNPLIGNTGVINATRYYRLRVQCSGGAFGYSNCITITVNNPSVTAGPNVSRCGVGTVNLTATGSNLKWYTTLTGGSPIGTGSPFTTPVISTTTDYFVSAASGGINASGGLPGTSGADLGYNGTDAGIIFDATAPFTLLSVKMYPQAAGTIHVQALTSAGVVIAEQDVTFTGATSTGVVVPLTGFNIPIGASHRLIVSSNPSNISIWRDFTPSPDYPYALGTVGTLIDGWLGTPIGTYYFFYDWQISTQCESNRVKVTAIVTPPPAFTSVSPAAGSPRTICSGGSVTLNAVGGGYTTYVWNPGALPNGSVVSPTTTTTYTVTAEIPGGCRRDSAVTIIVNATPTQLVINPANVSICPNLVYQVSPTGGQIPNQTVYSNNADATTGFTLVNNGTGTVNMAVNTTYFQQGTGSIHLTYGNSSDGGIETANIPLAGYTNPTLSFYHIAGLEASATNHWDVGYVEYSTDGGSVWTKFPASSYLGSGTLHQQVNDATPTGVGFDNTSYSDWDAQFSSSTSTPGVAPAASLWKQETIDLTSYQANSNFKIRFRILSDPSVIYFGWLIDNIRISGTGIAPVTWSPQTNLYTTPAHTTQISAGVGYSTVYYWVGVNTPVQTYTATATSGVNCSSTATVSISANSAAPSVSIAANPAGTICGGTCVTFTATPVNGGAGAAYKWRKNGIDQTTSVVGATTFSVCNLVNGDVIDVIMSVVPNICFPGGTTVTSPGITMAVNPRPTANNITGSTGTTVCNGVPNILTETAVGTITTYQWYLDGSPVGGNSSTYPATLPGTYTVAVTTNLGCKDTSNAFVVTQPTNTITATAGANGTITPSGAVAVPCGADQAFTISPNAGYSIQDVLVNGVSVGPVTSYTFLNVTGDSTISVTFFVAGCATPATANAGPDASICSNVNFTLAGTIGGSATTGTWSTSGTGTFNPNNTFGTATSYTPSAADAGTTVVLTLLTNDPPGTCPASTSSMNLEVKQAPFVDITGRLGLCTVGATTTYLIADTSTTAQNITAFQWFNGATPVGTNNDSLLVSAVGTYSVRVTGANGCTFTDVQAIAMFASPSVTIAGSGPICTDAAVDLNANATPGSGTVNPNGYQWYLGGPIAGANVSVLSASSPGSYTVTASNSNGCISAASAAINLAADNSPLAGLYTIGAGPASCTNYVSFAKAINDLNTRTISANVIFSVSAGYTEIVPPGGLKLGSAGLNAKTSPAGTNFTITFNKNGIGANPILTSYSGVAIANAATPDGIWSFNGVDNVTVTEIDLAESASNTNPTTTMEYGFGLFKLSATDGAQSNTIQNCTITLNKLNSTGSGALPMLDGSTGIMVINALRTSATTAITTSSAAGANSNNKFYGNLITNCHVGIGLSGFAAPSPYTLGDTNNDIGGTSAATGNSITNFGNASDGTAAIGVRVINQWGVRVSQNTIRNNNGSGVNTTNDLRGIRAEASAGADGRFSSNTIILTTNSAGGSITGIESAIGSGGTSNLVLITNNTITDSSAVGTGVAMTGISSSATAGTVEISNNNIRNCDLQGVGTFTGIANTGAAANVQVLSNVIDNNKKSSTGTMNLISMGAPTNSTISLNTLSRNTVTGGSANVTLNCIISGTSNYTVSGNTIINNSIINMSGGGIASIFGYTNIASPLQETLTNNVIRKLFITGTGSTGLHVIRGIYNNTSNNASHFRIVKGNQVDSLYTSSGLSAAITGILSQVGFNVTISHNKIHSLWPGQSATAGAFAKGISVNSGTTVKVFNNSISLDFTQAAAPAANNVLTAATAVSGFEMVAGSAAVSLYYNTIRLAGGGSGTAFGSSGVMLFINTGSVDIRNNIVANYMSAGSSGRSVALRRTVAAFGNYPVTSNNNVWYTTQTPTTPLYTNGTTDYATLALFKAHVAPRETLSLADNPVFVSTALNDLHLDAAANCNFDGAAAPIAGYTDDYDLELRNAVTPDIGMDEFNGTGTGFTWKGVNTDWMNPANWCGGVPTATSDVIIPTGKAFYPIIITNEPVARNITIDAGGTITINAGGTLSTTGSWTNNGVLTNSGTIVLNGTTNQVFPGTGTGTLPSMANLTVNNSGGATLNKAMTLLGVLKPKLGNIAVNDNITLHSDASGTASVDTIQGSISYGAAGKFIVERYISSLTKTGWRFLSIPTTTTETIKAAWQNGETAPTYTPTGYGMQIIGPASAGTGFDVNTTLPSMKTYDQATNTWISVPGTNVPIATTQGYMTFIRGDRGANTLGQMSATTLRTQGPIKTGPVTVSTANANTNKFISVGNPFPSAIDFLSPSTVKTGLQTVYYLWDPKLGTYGGYQTFSSVNGYVANPGGGSYSGGNKFIESGQAFFVVTTAAVAPHSITMVENSKVGSNVQVARATDTYKQLKTRLYVVSGSDANLYDGTSVVFDAANTNAVDDNDAPKLSNFGENFAIINGGKLISVESRAEVVNTDTVHFALGQLRQRQYKFEFIPEQLDMTGMTAYLEDKFLNTSTVIDMVSASDVLFEVTSDPASAATDRFRIVFRQLAPVPVSFTQIQAIRQGPDVAVIWAVENEANIHHYEVERSTNGRDFVKIGMDVAAVNADASQQYQLLDQQPFGGDNFYRIKGVGIGSDRKFSNIARVNMSDPGMISVYPNPVKEDGIVKVNLQNQDKGLYTADLLSENGQRIFSKKMNHAGGNAVYTLSLGANLTHGKYIMRVSVGNKVKSAFKIIY